MEYSDIYNNKHADVNAILPFQYCGNNSLTEFNIEDGIVEIRSCAFSNCKNLKTVTFPETLLRIDDNAFVGCDSLEEIIFPKNLIWIDVDAFRLCKKLKHIKINSKNVLTIRTSAFADCISLDSVEISGDIVFDGVDIFARCINLSLIDLQNVYSHTISNRMFAESGISSIFLPSQCIKIEKNAFMDCAKLETIDLATIHEIGSAAFKNCSALVSVELPSTLIRLDSEAFDNCQSLSTIIDHSQISVIYPETFSDCVSLSTVTFNSNTVALNYSFHNCKNLMSTNILCCEKYAFDDICCGNMQIVDHISKLYSIDLSSAQECEHERNSSICHVNLVDVDMIGRESFQRMYELSSIDLPDLLTTIQAGAFYNCFKLKSIIIPEYVTEIPEECFYNCVDLTSITCKGKISMIDRCAFYNCINLEYIHGVDFNDVMCHPSAFKNCKKMKYD